jgi:hypothetical protein
MYKTYPLLLLIFILEKMDRRVLFYGQKIGWSSSFSLMLVVHYIAMCILAHFQRQHGQLMCLGLRIRLYL